MMKQRLISIIIRRQNRHRPYIAVKEMVLEMVPLNGLAVAGMVWDGVGWCGMVWDGITNFAIYSRHESIVCRNRIEMPARIELDPR